MRGPSDGRISASRNFRVPSGDREEYICDRCGAKRRGRYSSAVKPGARFCRDCRMSDAPLLERWNSDLK